MSGAPTIVMKGGIIRKIDERLASPRPEFLDELLRMAPNEHLSDLAINHNHGTLRPDQKRHADVDWFGQGQGWWPTLQNKEQKVRWAYIQALRISLSYEPPRPIRTFWVAGIPNVFQCYVHDTAEDSGGVIVFWVTPPVARVGQPVRDETSEDLWVVASPEEIAAIRARFPDGYETEEPEQCADGVVMFKSTGY